MSEELQAAIFALTETYQSLHLVARGLRVDAAEVAEELAKATPNTAEHIALTVLAEVNLT